MKYVSILFNRNVLWIIGTLIVLVILTTLLIQRVEREVKGLQKFRETHQVVIPTY